VVLVSGSSDQAEADVVGADNRAAAAPGRAAARRPHRPGKLRLYWL